MALAFGLGNRDLAGDITREWYERYKKERDEAVARETAEDDALDDDSGGATPPAADVKRL